MNENAPKQELNSVYNKSHEISAPVKKGHRLLQHELQQEIQKIQDDSQLYSNSIKEDYILTQEIQKIQANLQPRYINLTKYTQENLKLHKEFEPEAHLHSPLYLNIWGWLDAQAGSRAHHTITKKSLDLTNFAAAINPGYDSMEIDKKAECSKLCETAAQFAELSTEQFMEQLIGECKKACFEL